MSLADRTNIAEVIYGSGQADQHSDRPKPRTASQATHLVELLSDAELFHTLDGEPHARIAVASHYEVWSVRSPWFRKELARRFYAMNRATPSSQAISDALNVLEGMALNEGKEYSVFVRLAEHEGAIYLDLADREWRAVEITPSGWRLVSNPPSRFRRSRGMAPLPEPLPGGQVDGLRQFLNVSSEDHWRLVVAWLLSTFSPDGPYPVLVLHGEQGAAKSSMARVLRDLIDPNTAPLRAAPRDERDLIIAARNGWVIALDNLSRVPDWLSDVICRLATGGGFSTRELYSDMEEVLFNGQRPVILNGIDELVSRGDLLDRSLIVELPAISEERRRGDREFRVAFEEARPYLLGAILEVITATLRARSTVTLPTLPRLADFAIRATAAEDALEWLPGTFLRAYNGNRDAANALALEASPLAPILRDLAERNGYTGTAADLLDVLASRNDEIRWRQGWPQSPRALGAALRRLAPNLRMAGVEVQFMRETRATRRRLITIRKVEQISVHTVHSVHRDCPDGLAAKRDSQHVASTPDDGTKTSNRGNSDPAQVLENVDVVDALDDEFQMGKQAGTFL